MNDVAALLPSDAPISATAMAAFVLATLALVFVVLARRDAEPGLAWLSVGFGLAALWYGFEAAQPPVDALLDTPDERFWAVVLVLAIVAMSLGVIDHLREGRARGRLWILLLAPTLISLVPLALGVDVPRLLVNLGTMICYLGLAALAFHRAGAEPGHGHVLLGLTLLAVPCTYATLEALGTEPAHYRVLGVMPMLFFGTTLLTVSLLRRRRALEAEVARRAVAERALQDANRTLEATVQARTQSLRELVSNLEGFNRSVSHDLRGPLGGIAGLARLAIDAMASGDFAMVRRSLAAILSQAETSTKLITALLQLARVGDARIARRTVALEALTHDVIAQLRLSPGAAADAQFIVGALPDVEADPDLLRPVLVNLITNALKFSRDAHPPVVRIDASVDSGEVTVHVRDNGVGFDAAAAGQLFEPFMRLHGRSFEGHGIGLSIVRRAVERHGGRVWAEGTPDHGAAFHFTLPRAT